MGVDQLKNRANKFSGAHLYPDGSTNSRLSFSQVGENDAAAIYTYERKRIQSTESSVPVDRKLHIARKVSFLGAPSRSARGPKALAPQLPFESHDAHSVIQLACFGFGTSPGLLDWSFMHF